MKKRTMKMRKIAGLSRRLAALMMIVVFALSGTALTGCGSDNKTAQNTSGDAKQYDGKLEFDHTMELKYAKLFKVVTIRADTRCLRLLTGMKTQR